MEEENEEKEKILIPLDEVSSDFNDHLNLENNKRILFSAPFGAGKSFFLDQYFNGTVEKLSIRLHPVDYSVASNEDIFELMKHDIINALIEKYGESLKLDKADFSNLLLAQEFMRNKMDLSAIGKALFSALVPNGDAIVKVGEEVAKLNDDFNNFKAEISKGQEKIIKGYLAELKSKKGSIRENDAVTIIIKDYVGRIKRVNDNKPFIFILDDLDRLDPEHLFRLFNVFTAHQDSKEDINKFDFDQLVFVCDVKNIHHMFKHKYGKKVDFSGYIDKFYSSHIFKFDFKKFLKESAKKLIMDKYIFAKKGQNNLPTYIYERYDFKNNARAKDWGLIIEHIIGAFIDYDLIKIRNFERFKCYIIPEYEFEYLSARKNYAYDYYFLVFTFTVQQFFPRLYEFEKALEVMSKAYLADYSEKDQNYYYSDGGIEDWIIQISLPFIMEPQNAFGLSKQEGSSFEYANEYNQQLEIFYKVDYNGLIQYNYSKIAHIPELEKGAQGVDDVNKKETGSERPPVKRPNPYWFLLEAFKQARKRGFLKD